MVAGPAAGRRAHQQADGGRSASASRTAVKKLSAASKSPVYI
jgi:hypothetical protein